MITLPIQFVSAANASGLDVFDQWGHTRGMRGKDISDTIAKIMRWWVSFAINKIPKADAHNVRQKLMEIVTAYSRTGGGDFRLKRQRDMADNYRGTLAAAIVFALDYKGKARSLAKERSPAFYGLVGQFINARVYSAGIHRSGFAPALRVLNQSGPQPDVVTQLPKYKHPTGTIAHEFTEDLAHILVENFATAADKPWRTADGITFIGAGVLETALGEVIQMVEGFLLRDVIDAARDAGWHVEQERIAADSIASLLAA